MKEIAIPQHPNAIIADMTRFCVPRDPVVLAGDLPIWEERVPFSAGSAPPD